MAMGTGMQRGARGVSMRRKCQQQLLEPLLLALVLALVLALALVLLLLLELLLLVLHLLPTQAQAQAAAAQWGLLVPAVARTRGRLQYQWKRRSTQGHQRYMY